jgi:hypothetical protein
MEQVRVGEYLPKWWHLHRRHRRRSRRRSVYCAYYVLNSLESNATAATKTAATKTEAGRVVADVPLAVPFAGAA